MTTPDIPDGAFLATDDPARAQGAVADFEEAARTKVPANPEIVSTFVELPCGLEVQDQTITTAVLRELNGWHEEELARAARSQNYYHYLSTLLECGVKQLGDETDAGKIKKLLKLLCAGDRDHLMIQIRRVTYGDDIDYKDLPCIFCAELLDITINLTDDIDVVKRSPAEMSFEVELSGNRTARARLANGADQDEIGKIKNATPAETNTVLVKNCVIEIKDNTTGRSKSMLAYPAMAREISMNDRRLLVKKIIDQPGPQYNKIKYTCPNCEREGTLALDVNALFLV